MPRQHIITTRFISGGLLAALALSGLAGCSTQQGYGAGQAWQRNECYKIAQLNDRQRCLQQVDRSYDDYQKDVDKLGAGKAASQP